jgi:DNA-binding IclR family transcriptional regulator
VLYVLGLLQRADRPLRFNELMRSVEGVTQKSLTKTLRTLERDGFVDRRVPARGHRRLGDAECRQGRRRPGELRCRAPGGRRHLRLEPARLIADADVR